MKLLFITSYLSIHTAQLFRNIIGMGDVDFVCVECEEETEERKKMHYKTSCSNIKCLNFLDFKEKYDYKQKYDVVIVSDFSHLSFVSKINTTFFFFMCEHVRKNSSIKNFLVTVKRYLQLFFLFKKSKSYVLCNSSFVGKEYSKAFFIKEQILKFGYFPLMTKVQNVHNKNKTILWSGRLLDWKHPEIAIHTMNQFAKHDSNYNLIIVGDGPEIHNVKKEIKKYSLENIFIYNFLDRESLLNLMSESEIYIFSSDRGEGWGVVLNEALYCGCIVFANKNAGATNFLVKDTNNGFVFSNKKTLEGKINYYIALNTKEKKRISGCAKESISSLWNDEIASKRLYILIKELIECGSQKTKYTEGPISNYFDARKK